ncbi:MAG TPA: translation elongation factor 4 [Candidatus Limnocylindrales bacterium]|jgi:GTP-binding protein LepA|nr:translation elongation factor 4 [Candidatus Limnocylindrales bacterium]
MVPQARLRNFSIIAHIDHGKSTLADRLLELTHTIEARQMTSQVLDSMDLEREKGITIKARAVRLEYTARDGERYALNLIDTPGHVDFTYEVSRSLQACEGAILVVDAAQGVEAQTLANVHLALEAGLVIVPVINKIDLPSADPALVAQELEEVLAIPREEVILASAKEGTGVPEVLEAIVERIPPPAGDPAAPLQGLIFDSHYDAYKGVVAYVRLAQGRLGRNDAVRLMASGAESELLELGVFRPQLVPVAELSAGEVGYVATGLKSVRDCQVGDTLTLAARPAAAPLPGYKPAKPLVFAGIYPVEGTEYPLLRDALEKLHLNDASISFEPESSVALGFGFRCGFLGLLHMEIVQERLEREFGLDLIASAPSVEYVVRLTHDRPSVRIDNPARLPPPADIEAIAEPWVKVSVVTPAGSIGPLIELATTRRGTFAGMEYLDPSRVLLTFEMPLGEVIVDLHDQLKSRSQGYASMDYEPIGEREADLVKLDVLVNQEPVDALSLIVHRSRGAQEGRALVERLRELIPRQMFEVPVQAAIGSQVVARETIRAMRKNVLAKCYGGDVTRKRKLLEKQKAGKQRMKRIGSVEIPQEAFLAVLRTGESGS